MNADHKEQHFRTLARALKYFQCTTVDRLHGFGQQVFTTNEVPHADDVPIRRTRLPEGPAH
jgi:hypothetical protein